MGWGDREREGKELKKRGRRGGEQSEEGPGGASEKHSLLPGSTSRLGTRGKL